MRINNKYRKFVWGNWGGIKKDSKKLSNQKVRRRINRESTREAAACIAERNHG